MLSKRLQQAMQEAGINQAQLARACGVKPPSVHGWLNGKSKFLRGENLLAAARVLNVSQGWLATGKGSMKMPPDADPPNNLLVEQEQADDISIPEYDVAGAMGNGGLILEEQPPGVITGWRVDHEWLRLNVPSHTGIKNLCIVTGFGASMQPKYNPGDPLLMDSGIKEVRTDGIYFFRIGDHGFIKQLQRIPKGSEIIIRAKSLNPDYDPFEITPDMDFHVLGKILTVWRSEQV